MNKQRKLPFLNLMSMHHIYNDEKKHYITLLAANKDLTGLYLFGKPGRVIVEGEEPSVKSYCKSVRKWRWQNCEICSDYYPSFLWRERTLKMKFKKEKHHHHGNNVDSAAVALLLEEKLQQIDRYERVFNSFKEVKSEDELIAELKSRELDSTISLLQTRFSGPKFAFDFAEEQRWMLETQNVKNR